MEETLHNKLSAHWGSIYSTRSEKTKYLVHFGPDMNDLTDAQTGRVYTQLRPDWGATTQQEGGVVPPD